MEKGESGISPSLTYNGTQLPVSGTDSTVHRQPEKAVHSTLYTAQPAQPVPLAVPVADALAAV
jgi:hypothetical protein